MKIQWVRTSRLVGNENSIEYTTFSSPNSLDSFDLNIFDLSQETFWGSDYYTSKLFKDNDLKLINKMIASSSKTKILILLPQDLPMKHGSNKTLLKNMLDDFIFHIEKLVKTPFEHIEFEPTETKVDGEIIKADFYFSNGGKVLTKSNYSEKVTTIVDESERYYFTSLNINAVYDINLFLREIGILDKKKKSEPEWMGGIEMFDDNEQLERILIAEQKIDEEQILIDQSNQILEQNKRYKSILYTQSDELVDVVFEMIEEMLDINLSNFEDNKKEDLSFELDGNIFIIEIKGLTSNIKMNNLSQLDRHYTDYIDAHPEVDNKSIYKLLIINSQRTIQINERKEIHESQIDAAKRKYEQLIVETSELLKLFEKFKKQEVTKQEVIELFQHTGKLTIEQ